MMKTPNPHPAVDDAGRAALIAVAVVAAEAVTVVMVVVITA